VTKKAVNLLSLLWRQQAKKHRIKGGFAFMGLLWILFYLFFAFAPILCVFYVIKGKKIWLFNLITILVTAALVGYDFFAAYNAEDFHTAAFIFQLFLPIQVASAILTFVIGNLILLKKRGFLRRNALRR
jgi:hypothetical protein